MKQLQLSIIIVNFNTRQDTLECLASIKNTVKSTEYEIILVDNSTDEGEIVGDITDSEGNITFIRADNNGYANANNIGIRAARGEYILLLNPDTVVYADTIDRCMAYIKKHGDIGALGCRVLRPSGELDHACRRGFPTPFNSLCYFLKLNKLFPKTERFGRYTYSYLEDTASCEVDSLMGAFMLIPRSVLDRVGLLDESFFMYGEDIDLCYRIKESGKKVFYYADYTILHKKYQSGIAKGSPFVIKWFYKSMLLFYDKHYKKRYSFIVNAMVYVAIYCIMWLKLFKNTLLK